MNRLQFFEHEVRMASIAREENAEYSLIWHTARATMLLNAMSADEALHIKEDVFNAFSELDLDVCELLDREEQVINAAEEEIA